jgi:hypothetical protein
VTVRSGDRCSWVGSKLRSLSSDGWYSLSDELRSE